MVWARLVVILSRPVLFTSLTKRQNKFVKMMENQLNYLPNCFTKIDTSNGFQTLVYVPSLQKSPDVKIWAHGMLALYTQFHPWSIPVIHMHQ